MVDRELDSELSLCSCAPQEVDVLRVEVNRRISQFFSVFLPSQKKLRNEFGKEESCKKKSKAMEGDGPLPRNCLIKPSESTGCMGTMAK